MPPALHLYDVVPPLFTKKGRGMGLGWTCTQGSPK